MSASVARRGRRAALPISPAPRAPLAYGLALLATAVWFFAGLLLDGWAHNHLDLSREGFFTPYHAVFYSGFVAMASVIGMGCWKNRARDRVWYRSFPQSYATMAIGIAIFALGGILDMLWHMAFGVEQDLQALFSPTHLLLAVGGATMMCGPIREGLARPDDRTWRERFGELLALAFFATLVSFFLMWAFTTGAGIGDDPHRLYPHLRGDAFADMRDYQMEHGITTVVLRSLVLAGVTGFAARRFALPFGAIALLVTLPNVAITFMLDPATVPVVLSLVASLTAGLLGDVAIARWRRLQSASWRSRAFAFGVPFVFWTVYLLLAFAASGGFWWSPHVAFGVPAIGGLAGLLLALSGESAARS